jgi:hypothetical protein
MVRSMVRSLFKDELGRRSGKVLTGVICANA